MALPQVTESFDIDGLDAQTDRQRTRNFTVIGSSLEDAFALVDSTYGVREGVAYESPQGAVPDPDLICLDLSANANTPLPSGGTGYIKVRASYGYRSARGTSIAPLTVNAAPRIRVLKTTSQRQVDTFAGSGHVPITNTADEPFDPPPTITVVNIAYSLEWQRLYANQGAADASIRWLDGKVNLTAYLGVAARCLYAEPVEIVEFAGTNATGLKTYEFRAVLRKEPSRTVKDGGADLTVAGWDFLKPNLGRRMKTRAAAAPNVNGPYREIKVIDIPTSGGGAPPFLNDPLFRQKPLWQQSPLVDQPVPLNFAGDTVVAFADLNWITGILYDTAEFNGIGA